MVRSLFFLQQLGLNSIQESSSFTGGNVLDWTPFVQSVGANAGVAFLPTTAATRFNYNAMYAGSQPLWREFVPIYGDYHIDRWDFSSDPVYSLSAAAFAGVTQASPVQAAAVACFADPAFTTALRPLGAPYQPVPLDEQGFVVPVPLYIATGVLAGAVLLALIGLVIACCVICRRGSGGEGSSARSALLPHA
jgi:hypothetical protein